MYLFLIRHGQSEGNVTNRLQGWYDAPLTPLGERQAVRTAVALSSFLQSAGISIAALYSSPLGRAARTADIISQMIGRPVATDPGLREMNFGIVEGLTEAEWKDCYPDLLAASRDRANLDFGWPEGETRRAFYSRIHETMTRLVDRHAPHEHAIVVSHGGFLSSYLSHLTTGEWHHWHRFPVNNCSITHLTLEPGYEHAPAISCLLTFNDTGHLTDADAEAITGST